MNFNLRRFFTSLLFTAFVFSPAAASPDWDKVRLSVTPGVGTQEFELGAPPPKEWPTKLGAPDQVYPFDGTGESFRRLIWGTQKKGRLHKGLSLLVMGEGEEATIVDIELKRIRAGVDDENLFLGLPAENISKRSDLVQKDGRETYLLPGLTIETEGGKMIGLLVHSPASTRWRFQRWRVTPGYGAGPIKIDEPVDESIFASIGKPHQRDSQLMLWEADDSAQTLKVTMEPRTGNVTRVRGIGLPWRTPNGATLGDSEQRFLKKHPEAKSMVGREIDETIYKLPGMRATFEKGKLTTFDVYPASR